MDDFAALLSETAPLSAAAPTAIMLATIMALLFISMACSRLMPAATLAEEAAELLTVSICVKSASVGKPKALLIAVNAVDFASTIKA